MEQKKKERSREENQTSSNTIGQPPLLIWQTSGQHAAIRNRHRHSRATTLSRLYWMQDKKKKKRKKN
jgi:hypothetical protein